MSRPPGRPAAGSLAAEPSPAFAADPDIDLSRATWRKSLTDAVHRALDRFVADRCVPELRAAHLHVAADVLTAFLDGGKCLRPTFLYLGWRCGAHAPASDSAAAVRAAASLELLHAFALLQDDVMDAAALRRGRPTAHLTFARWHRGRGLPGCSDRFGESAAVLLGDLCLVWAGQMLRDSGMPASALGRAWPRYDRMRTELAIGQFGDLTTADPADGRPPTLAAVLAVARRKSGHYTVTRPLEIGAALAGCPHDVLTVLTGYGHAVGEAFQLRDDLLDLLGSPAVTGKPAAGDLREGKYTSVVAAAYRLADAAARRRLRALIGAPHLDEDDIRGWRELIIATGAVDLVERMIDMRLARSLALIEDARITPDVRTALADMAIACTERAA